MRKTDARHLKRGKGRTKRGFSIVELLVAVLIIGILSSILVPSLSQHAEKARIARAMVETETIAAAQERAAGDGRLGHFLRLFALNNVPQGDGVGLGGGTDVADGIGDEPNNTIYTVNTNTSIFITTIKPQILEFNNSDAREAFYRYRLGVDPTVAGGDRAERWNGPYLNIKDDQELIDHDSPNDRLHCHGIPNDPWGNDYLLFLPDTNDQNDSAAETKGGLVGEPDGYLINPTWKGAETQVFDRPTILSLGPNGVPGNGTGSGIDFEFGKGDDIYHQFGQ